ncbi:MAG: class I SAM-dependent methyltransferase [Pirellulales bacterium]
MPFGPEKRAGLRYWLENAFYSYTDGIVLYSMIRHLRPQRIIEIGSGFSSAVTLDTNQRFFDSSIKLHFIEPFPERLRSLMTAEDTATIEIRERFVQDVDPELFARLEKNDILFVDSTHVSKTGSDVNDILFRILPLLRPGVFVHFHDVFYPFEYPQEWVFKGRNWNEAYLLRAFLSNNSAFAIRFFGDYLHRFHPEAFAEMPLTTRNHGGGIWIEKL